MAYSTTANPNYNSSLLPKALSIQTLSNSGYRKQRKNHRAKTYNPNPTDCICITDRLLAR